MENYQTTSDLEDRLENLKQRRHELGNPHNGNLKSLEEPVRYVLDNLGQELDPMHALQLYDAAFNDGSGEYDTVHEILEGSEYSWEMAADETGLSVNSNRRPNPPSREDIIRDPEGAFEEALEEFEVRPGEPVDFTRDTAMKISNKFRDYLHLDDYMDASKGLEEAYERWKDNFTKFFGKMQAIDGAAKQLAGGFGHRDEESIEEMEESFGKFFMDERRNPEEYKSLEAQLPSVGPALPYEMAREFLDHYEAEIEKIEDSIEDSEPEYEWVETTETERELKVNWDDFADKPEYERDLIETAAKFQKQSGQEVDSELLGAVVADANGADVEYSEDIKGVNRSPNVDTTLGDIKTSVKEVDDLDFVLPVMEKDDELNRISREIEKAAQSLEWSEIETTRREKRKVS